LRKNIYQKQLQDLDQEFNSCSFTIIKNGDSHEGSKAQRFINYFLRAFEPSWLKKYVK